MSTEVMPGPCFGTAGRSDRRRPGQALDTGAARKPLSANGIEREAPCWGVPGANQAKREGAAPRAVNQWGRQFRGLTA